MKCQNSAVVCTAVFRLARSIRSAWISLNENRVSKVCKVNTGTNIVACDDLAQRNVLISNFKLLKTIAQFVLQLIASERLA